MALTAKQQSRHDELVRIKDRVADQILAMPGVTGIGVAFKRAGDKATDELCITISVAKKDAPEVSKLPSAIDGAPTCIVEREFKLITTFVRRQWPETQVGVSPDTGKYDPLIGGVSLGPSREIDGGYTVGTLGLMVQDLSSGKPSMLSNYHVMCDSDGKAKVGDEMCQPSRVDSWIQWCSNCAKLTRWYAGNFKMGSRDYGIDAAIAEETHRNRTYKNIAEIGEVGDAAAPAINDAVQKRGRTTRLTTGIVDDVSHDVNQDFGPPYGKITLRNMILVRADSGSFIEQGDSGSCLVKIASTGPERKVLGLLNGYVTAGAMACDMRAVMQALNIGL